MMCYCKLDERDQACKPVHDNVRPSITEYPV